MIYLLAFLILLAVEKGYFYLADKNNIIDKPNERSSHKKTTLRGGGIVFYFGILLYFLANRFQYPWFFIGLTVISIVSFMDDIKPQATWLRLAIHFIGMILMFNQWGLYEMPWYFTLISLIFCTGILNAYNFMDGINGITGGYSVVVIASIWYINSYQVAFVDANLLYSLLLALLVFNFYNFRTKAKCFAGDVGAISIAFVIVFLLGLLIIKTGDFSYILLLALYGVDSILTIIHRLMLREHIFSAHRSHLFQIMANELKINHLVVSSIYMIIQLLISVGLIFTQHRYWYFLVVIVSFSLLYIYFMRRFFHLHTNK